MRPFSHLSEFTSIVPQQADDLPSLPVFSQSPPEFILDTLSKVTGCSLIGGAVTWLSTASQSFWPQISTGHSIRLMHTTPLNMSSCSSARSIGLLRPLKDVTVTAGETATFECELSYEGIVVEWFLGGQKMEASERVSHRLYQTSQEKVWKLFKHVKSTVDLCWLNWCQPSDSHDLTCNTDWKSAPPIRSYFKLTIQLTHWNTQHDNCAACVEHIVTLCVCGF